MNLVFEKSAEGRETSLLPGFDVPVDTISDRFSRKTPLGLPSLSESDVSRHFCELSHRSFGVTSGFYPLGSCTMKYNPAVNEEIASDYRFTDIHPLQKAMGCEEILSEAEKLFNEITGMDAMTFQPAAGAHGEFTGLLIIKSYHRSRGDVKRDKILIPDSAHGTNPASASMAGFKTVTIKSGPDGKTDLNALKASLGNDTAGIMLTNPNTAGIFDDKILEITKLVHDNGGLCYYDGANMNALTGIVRPGDMGFDIVHLNLHKTFAAPHGGGGPGSGPTGCKNFLKHFLPVCASAGHKGLQVRAFHGNFLVILKAFCYVLSLGADGLREVSENAVLNANYLKKRLESTFTPAYEGPCMHEFVLTLVKLKRETGVSAQDIAKALIDKGIHPPTVYFPLTVREALMFEPTETESKETLDKAADILTEIYNKAYSDANILHAAPVNSGIKHPDELEAARHPVLKY